MTGTFVAFEGGEGSGKTTQVRLLNKALDYDALTTRQMTVNREAAA